jgi:hypothetical protein
MSEDEPDQNKSVARSRSHGLAVATEHSIKTKSHWTVTSLGLGGLV